MIKALAPGLIALLVAGCASPEAPAPAGAAVVAQNCAREVPIGSSVPVTRCRSAEDIERDAKTKQSMEDALSRRSGPSGAVPKN